MLNIFNRNSAKQSARALERFLKAKGFDLKHGEAMDALATMSGNKNWAALAPKLTEEAMNRELYDFELAHAYDAAQCDIRGEEGGTGYGLESALVVHTGFSLRYSAVGELLEYVRVCDPMGRECMYWHYNEWQEDPQVVMGAILGALARGRSLDVNRKGELDWGAADSTVTKRSPRIQDLDFNDVSSVLVDGVRYRLGYFDGEVVGELQESTGEQESDRMPALELVREDDLKFELTVSLQELRGFAWDPKQRAFVGQGGRVFRFMHERGYGLHAQEQPARVEAPRHPEAAKATSVPAAPRLSVIQDVNFADVSHVFIDGVCHDVRTCEPAVLARLRQPAGDEDSEMEYALHLGRDDDGIVYESEMTLEELRELVWEPKEKKFVDPTGQHEYIFCLSFKFGE